MTREIKNLNKISLLKTNTIKDAIKILNKEVDNQIILVIEKNKLIGTITDGDIRRSLLKGFSINVTLDKVMYKKYKFLIENEKSFSSKLNQLISEGYNFIPIINYKKEIVKVLSTKKNKSKFDLWENYTVVIMAGGKGSRLESLTKNTPKALIKIKNKPILELIIRGLLNYNLKKIYISINHFGNLIKKYFGDGSSLGIEINYVEEKKPLGTIGSIKLIDDVKKNILVINCDLFNNINYENLITHHKKLKSNILIGSIRMTYSVPFGILEIINDKVIQVTEKPNYNYNISAGVNILSRSSLKLIPKNKYFDMTDLIDKSIKKNLNIQSYFIYEDVYDIGTLKSLLSLRKKIK